MAFQLYAFWKLLQIELWLQITLSDSLENLRARGATCMLLCVVIIKQALKFHMLNTDLELVKISTLITDHLVKMGSFSMPNCI